MQKLYIGILMALFFADFEQGASDQTYIYKMGTNYLKII